MYCNVLYMSDFPGTLGMDLYDRNIMTNFRRNEIGRTSWIYPCDIACILRNNNDKMTAKSHWFLTRPNSSPNLVHCQKPRAIRAALDGGVPGITRLSPWISAACSWVPQVILTSHVPSRWKSQTTTPISGQLQASCSVSRGPKPTTYNITTIELSHHHCRIE